MDKHLQRSWQSLLSPETERPSSHFVQPPGGERLIEDTLTNSYESSSRSLLTEGGKMRQNKLSSLVYCCVSAQTKACHHKILLPVQPRTIYYSPSLGFFLFFCHITLEVIDRKRLPGSILWMQCISPLSRGDLRPQHHLCFKVFGHYARAFCTVEIQNVRFNNCAEAFFSVLAAYRSF
jgi:hypothetical protein